jgi:hypothetical protein
MLLPTLWIKSKVTVLGWRRVASTRITRREQCEQGNYPDESLIYFIAKRFLVLPDEQERRLNVVKVDYGTGEKLLMIAKEGMKFYGLESIAAALDFARHHLMEK